MSDTKLLIVIPKKTFHTLLYLSNFSLVEKNNDSICPQQNEQFCQSSGRGLWIDEGVDFGDRD